MDGWMDRARGFTQAEKVRKWTINRLSRRFLYFDEGLSTVTLAYSNREGESKDAKREGDPA
jgi:hypothetical protein